MIGHDRLCRDEQKLYNDLLGMKKSPQHCDALLAINAAKSFFALAGTFFSILPSDRDAQSKYIAEHKGMLIAATTNLVFSVELYFKALSIATQGSAKHGHNLLELYQELPSDIQDSIDQCYRYRSKHDVEQRFSEIEFCVSPYNREPSEEEKKACRLNRSAGDDVCSLLEAEKDAFQIWRYLHEKPLPEGPICVTIHYHRMGVLVNAIQDQFVPPNERPNFVTTRPSVE